jgi:uncharacterized protein
MNLKAQISEDIKTAMRDRDTERLGAIRLLSAAIKQKEVDERVLMDDVGVIGIVDKMLKQRKDSIEAFQKAQRQDLADKEIAEVKVLQAYLPARLGVQEVVAEVRAILVGLSAELGRPAGPADMGKAMALAKTKLAGRADIAEVSAAVKAALAG